MCLDIIHILLFVTAIDVHHAAENNNMEIVVIQPSQLTHIQYNGEFEFDAFNNHYALSLQKHSHLFSPNFYSEVHGDKGKRRSTKIPNCHYQVTVLSDSWSNSTDGIISVCHNNSITGWIQASDHMLTIEKNSDSVDNEYIIYKRQTNIGLFPKNDIRRRISSQNTRYVELAVVNDPGMITKFGSDNNYQTLEDKTVSIISMVQSFFLNTDWGTDVGQIKIILSSIVYVESFGESTTDLSSPTCESGNIAEALYDSSGNGENTICEIDYADYLQKFQNYRTNNLNEFDNVQLFSYYNFYDEVRAYSAIPGMCIRQSSGGIAQTTFDDEFNAIIVSHSLGSNFDMSRDGIGNNCETGQYIMGTSSDPNGHRSTEFSICSIQYVQNFFNTYASTLKCLDNKPSASLYSFCGNGMVEQGEDCDCGSNDCSDIDSCCDGNTCAFRSGYECNNDDLCCENCMFKSASTVCRELIADNTCDIEAEVCDGMSSECPVDTHYVEGTKCEYINNDGNVRFGDCYNGECVSLEEQCEQIGLYSAASYVNCGFDLWILNENECDQDLLCANKETPDNCIVLDTLIHPQDGTPCNINSSSSLPAQCVNSECQLSMDVYTYVWKTYPWKSCSISCKKSNSDDAGNQNRKIECILQDGTAADDSRCGSIEKPIDNRKCNDFVCLDGTDDTDVSSHTGFSIIVLILCIIVSYVN